MTTDPGRMTPSTITSAGDRKEKVTAFTAALALFVATLYAGQSVAAKMALADVPKFMVMCLRIALCCAFIGAWARFKGQRLRISGRQFGLILLNAAILYTQMALFLHGTHLTKTVRGILIINSFPFFTAIACHYFLPGFPFTWRTISGLLVAFSGLVVVFGDKLAYTSGEITGELFILAAAMVMGCKIAFAKVLLRSLHPVQMIFWGALCAAPVCLTVSLLHEDVSLEAFTPQAIGAILFQGLAVSGLAVLIWGYLLSRHAPTDLTVFRLATPLLGVVLGWLILGETITPYVVVGAILLVTGCYQVMKK